MWSGRWWRERRSQKMWSRFPELPWFWSEIQFELSLWHTPLLEGEKAAAFTEKPLETVSRWGTALEKKDMTPNGSNPFTSPLSSYYWTTNLSRTRSGPSEWRSTCTALHVQQNRAWRSGDLASLAGGSPILFCRKEQQLDHKDSTRDNNQEKKSALWKQSNPSDKKSQVSISKTSTATAMLQWRLSTHAMQQALHVGERVLLPLHRAACKSEEKRVPLGRYPKKAEPDMGFNLLF